MSSKVRFILSVILLLAFTFMSVGFTAVSAKSVKFERDHVTLMIGQSFSLKAIFAPKNATKVNLTYSSSNTKVATVDSNGKISALKNGEVVVKAVSSDKKLTAACKVFVLKKGVTLTQNMWQLTSGATELPAPGDDINNNAYTRWAKSVLGVKVVSKWTTPEINNYDKINLAMASNDLPDVIRFPTPAGGNVPTTLIAQMIRAGQLLPLDGLIEKYGTPLAKYMIAENKKGYGLGTYAAASQNGKLYAFPNLVDNGGDKTLLYRKDLLDSIGKKYPTNFNELEDVFAAFKAKYPDKICLILTNNFFGIRTMFTANGTLHGHWISDGKGGLIYGGIHPGAKAMLERAAQWYKKGYIDREFAVKAQTKAFETFAAGNCLMTEMNYYNLAGGPLMAISKNVPQAKLDFGPYIKDKDAGVYIAPSFALNTYFGISAKCKNPEFVIFLFNEFLESALRNEKDLRAKFSFKYPEEPSQTPINQDVAKGDKVNQAKYSYKVQGPAFFNDYIPWYWVTGFQLNRPFTTLNAWEEISKALETNKLNSLSPSAKMQYDNMRSVIDSDVVWNAHVKNMMLNKKYMETGVIRPSLFAAPPTKTMIDKKAYLDKLELETYTKIIMGELPISAFDDFVANWKTNGGDAMTAEVNQWYNSVK